MAKSLRSKWRRKCRAVKRERYGKKELDRLKKTLGIDETKSEVQMEDVSEVATVVKAEKMKKEAASKQTTVDVTAVTAGENSMETDDKARVFNLRTRKDQHGTHPIWMHQRKIKKSKKAARIAKKKR